MKDIHRYSAGLTALNGGLFVSPGYGFHKTRVLDTFELVYVIEGDIDFFEDDISYCVGSSQTLLLSPGRRHGSIRPYHNDLRFYWLHFLADNVSETPLTEHSTLSVPKQVSLSRPQRLSELFHRFVSDQESRLLTPTVATRLLMLILCEVARQGGELPNTHATKKVLKTSREDLIERTLSLIDEVIVNNLGVAGIAREIGVHPDHLERIFRTHTGERLIDAINRRKIDTACVILREEASMNVNEVATRCGFKNTSYFHRVFRRITGLSPRRFRSLYPRTHINTH